MDKCWEALPEILTEKILYEIIVQLQPESSLDFYSGITRNHLDFIPMGQYHRQKYIFLLMLFLS